MTSKCEICDTPIAPDEKYQDCIDLFGLEQVYTCPECGSLTDGTGCRDCDKPSIGDFVGW